MTFASCADQLKKCRSGVADVKGQQGGIEIKYRWSKVRFSTICFAEQVGDKVFFSTLRNLATSHAGKTLSLDELRRAFIEVAPDSNLPQFFQQWLDRNWRSGH